MNSSIRNSPWLTHSCTSTPGTKAVAWVQVGDRAVRARSTGTAWKSKRTSSSILVRERATQKLFGVLTPEYDLSAKCGGQIAILDPRYALAPNT